MLNSSVLSWRRNVVSDGTTLSVVGRMFQARAAATENAQLPRIGYQTAGRRDQLALRQTGDDDV